MQKNIILSKYYNNENLDEKDLKEIILDIDLCQLLRKKKLSLEFICENILNENNLFTEEEKLITIEDIMAYQNYSRDDIIKNLKKKSYI